VRDEQKSKVYAAEHTLAWLFDTAAATGNPMVTVSGVTVTLPPEAKFSSVESMQAYVNRVMDMLPTDRKTPKVRHRSGTAKAHYHPVGEIAIPTARGGSWARRELVVLHELAHHLTPGSGHNHRYVQAFLELVGRVMGPEVALVGRIIFDDNGVRCTPPPKRVRRVAAQENPKASA